MLIGSFKYNKNQIIYQNTKRFKKVIDIIQSTNFSNIEDGRYPIDNLDLYYLLTTYKTKKFEEKSPAEAHRKYIDFQYIICGEEFVGYADYQNPKRSFSYYDLKKDIEQFGSVSNESFFLLKKDIFTIFYPYEIHRPGIARDKIRSVRKVIFKILAKEAK